MPIADLFPTVIAKGDIRYAGSFSAVSTVRELIASRSRLARRGGIKRISGTVYDEARDAMVDRLKTVIFSTFEMIDIVGTNLHRLDPAGMRNLPGSRQTPE